MNNNFATKLYNLRTSHHLTSAELANKANVPPSLISGLQSGNRVIGEYTAKKIGNALQLTGNELEEFVYAAINNCSEKILESSKKYPAELLNFVACKLRELGIAPDEINRCDRNEKDAASLFLKDGSEARITVEVAIE